MEHILFTYGKEDAKTAYDCDLNETVERTLHTKQTILYLGGKFILMTYGYNMFDHWDVCEKIVKRVVRKKTKTGPLEWSRGFNKYLSKKRCLEMFASGVKVRSFHIVYGPGYTSGMSSLIDMKDAVIQSETITEEYLKAKSYLESIDACYYQMQELESLYSVNLMNLPKGTDLVGAMFDDVIKTINQHINS